MAENDSGRKRLRVGDEVRVPFGSYGTQLARIEKLSETHVSVRCYRANSKRWNQRLHRWKRAVFEENIS